MKFKPGQTVYAKERKIPGPGIISGRGIILAENNSDYLVLAINMKNIPEAWIDQKKDLKAIIPEEYHNSKHPAFWFNKPNISIDRKENLKLI